MTDKPKTYAVAEPVEVATFMSLHHGAYATAEQARKANFRSELEARFTQLQRNCSDSVDALYALAEHNPDMLRVLVGDMPLETPSVVAEQRTSEALHHSDHFTGGAGDVERALPLARCDMPTRPEPTLHEQMKDALYGPGGAEYAMQETHTWVGDLPQDSEIDGHQDTETGEGR